MTQAQARTSDLARARRSFIGRVYGGHGFVLEGKKRMAERGVSTWCLRDTFATWMEL